METMTVIEYRSDVMRQNGFIKIGLNTASKISRGLDLFASYTHILKDTEFHLHSEQGKEFAAAIEAIVSDPTDEPILRPISLEAIDQIPTHCTRCGKELVINFWEEKRSITCSDEECIYKAYEAMCEQELIDRVTESARKENRLPTQLDFFLERKLVQFWKENHDTGTLKEAYNMFYAANNSLQDMGSDLKQIAEDIETGMCRIACETQDTAYRAGFMEGMKYAASVEGGLYDEQHRAS